MKTVITSEYEALFRQHFRLATLYAAIYRLIEALPEQGRRIFKMICIEHKSYVETARLLSLSLHTVKTHMSRSFKALRKMSMFFLTLF